MREIGILIAGLSGSLCLIGLMWLVFGLEDRIEVLEEKLKESR